jgi:hypothetical protein
MRNKRRFILKLILFILPFVFIVGGFTALLIYCGESMPLAWVVALQSGDTPVLYRPQYGNRDVQFKALSINTRKPAVIALGSSRVLQMRAGLFTEQLEAFYNAGAPAWTLSQVKALLDSLAPDAVPSVIILGIDPPWFNDAYQSDDFPDPIDDLSQIAATNRSVAQAALEGRPLNLAQWFARGDRTGEGIALGIKAIENSHGFRNDGSERYGDFLVAGYLYQPTERERHLHWMRNGEQMYVYGDTVSETGLRQIIEILAWGKARGVTIIGFLPPYAPELYERMTRRGNHPYMDELTVVLEDLFATYHYPFFNFSDGMRFGIDDDFFDGWHGSERVYLRLFTQMVEALPDGLGIYSDAEKLRSIDAQVTDTWRVFPF